MSLNRKTSLKLPKFTVDSIYSQELLPTDAQRLYPKGISASAFQRAWQNGFTGKDVIVAVIDTGIDGNNSDLKDKIIKSFNLTGEPLTESHGTHVAGTIAANGWLVGGAYDSKLIDIKVIGKDGASIDNIVKGIGIAASNGASIVNMSLGGTGLTNNEIQSLTNAIQDAWNKGCICIAAAGNDGTTICTPDIYEYPASIEKAESIAACNVSDDLNTISIAPFSNENNRVDLAACGVNVISTIIGGKYGVYSGTSMATPHVTAMAAVLTQFIRSKYPSLKGSTFSSNLVSLIHSNVLKINGCGTNTSATSCGYVSALSGQVGVQYTNISFGLGFLRFEPSKGPFFPIGEKFYNDGVFLGNIIV